MLKTLREALKIKDIRKKVLYTFLMLVVIRIGSLLPIPGVDTAYFKTLFGDAGDAFSFLNAFTGGSFSSMSLFALSITPYITSSIIMQLLTIAIPQFEEMQKEEDGRRKIAEYTRYVTIALALIESIAMAVGFGGNGLITGYASMGTGARIWTIVVTVSVLTAGSAMLMWIGERITENGIGNGISMVLLFNIISTIPEDFVNLYQSFVASAGNVAKGVLAAIIILAIIIVLVIFVIVLQDAERRIPVQYSQKMQGKRMTGGAASNIPLKVNTAGVIPVIFASSLMSTPVIVAQFFSRTGAEWTRYLSSSYWINPQYPKYSIGLLIYVVLVVFFAYFYTSITFNPLEIANNMKKNGGVIPGIRQGKPTSDYLNKILNYIVFIGACGLVVVAIVPIFCSGVFKASVSFGGTSVIIIVGVILETLKQMESQMVVRHCKGLFD